MIKFNGTAEDAKKLRGAKYMLSTGANPIALDGADLIPIDLGGRLITQSSIRATLSINELGKQLLRAAEEGDVDEIKSLLTKGAPFTADWLGTSPLHLASQNNHLEITEILLRAGISKDARTKVDRTPLHMATFEGHLQIVDSLIKHGADIDCKDLLGMTPLHWAVQNGHLEIIEYLIQHGAQIDVHNKFNLTPMMIAQQMERLDIENYINGCLTDPSMATDNLVIQLAAEDYSGKFKLEQQEFQEEMDLENSNHESIIIPIEPNVLQQFETETSEVEDDIIQEIDDCSQETDQDSIEKENEQLVQSVNVDTSHFSDSLKLLQEHGITMLQNDENEESNILNTVMESGHSVVLTDVGKEVLNSVKQSEQLQMEKKIVTVLPEEFLAMTNGNLGNRNILRQLKVIPMKSQTKRIVMKNNKIIPVTSVSNIPDDQKEPLNPSPGDMELVMTQLIEARKTIEEYKAKLHKKELEAERYKIQLKLLMDPK